MSCGEGTMQEANIRVAVLLQKDRLWGTFVNEEFLDGDLHFKQQKRLVCGDGVTYYGYGADNLYRSRGLPPHFDSWQIFDPMFEWQNEIVKETWFKRVPGGPELLATIKTRMR